MKLHLIFILVVVILGCSAFGANQADIDFAKARVLRSLNEEVSVYNSLAKKVVQISKDDFDLESISCQMDTSTRILCGLRVKFEKQCSLGSELVGIGVEFGLIRGYLFGRPANCSEDNRSK